MVLLYDYGTNMVRKSVNTKLFGEIFYVNHYL